MPPELARPWDSVRWLREPTAWTLLALTAIIVLVSACQLFSLAGAIGSHTRPGAWFILEGAGLAITAAALLFTSAVLWPRPFRSLAPLTQGPAGR